MGGIESLSIFVMNSRLRGTHPVPHSMVGSVEQILVPRDQIINPGTSTGTHPANCRWNEDR